MTGRGLRALVALYPRSWRERYGEELTDLLAAMCAERGRVRVAADVVRGAVDAHLHWRPDVTTCSSRALLRGGVLPGLAIAAVMVVVLFLSNVVFPAGPDESDNDPEYLIPLLAGYALLAVLFVAIGALARRRTPADSWAGARAGAVAGFVIAVIILVTTLTIDNAFLDLVSQQHDKRVAFAASGWSSMREYLTVRTLLAAPVVLPVATVLSGLLGAAGGVLARPRLTPQREVA